MWEPKVVPLNCLRLFSKSDTTIFSPPFVYEALSSFYCPGVSATGGTAIDVGALPVHDTSWTLSGSFIPNVLQYGNPTACRRPRQ